MTDPKPSPFNPSFWLAAGTSVITGIIAAAVTTAALAQRVDNITRWQGETQVWMVATDKRLGTVERDAAVATKAFEGFSKDMERLQRGVEDLKNAMMQRPAVFTPASGRQPYP